MHRAMKLMLASLLVGGLAMVVLPLRLITEKTYIAKSQPVDGGLLWTAFDGAYSAQPHTLWFDGLEKRSPYRIQLRYRPDLGGTHDFAVERLVIRDVLGGIIIERPQRTAVAVSDREKQEEIIVAYLDVPLDANQANLEATITLDGKRHEVRFDLKEITQRQIVHAGIEALMGI